MRRIGTQLIAEKKAEIMREYAERKEKGGEYSGVERKDLRSRDLLTLLLKANMATDIPDNQRLSDEDVLSRMCMSTSSVSTISHISLPTITSFRGPDVSPSAGPILSCFAANDFSSAGL